MLFEIHDVPFQFNILVMWLWSAGRGHLAVSVTRELRHIFSQLSITFSCQPSHCHWHSDHGDRLPGLPRCYQGKQVPPVELFHRFADNSPGGADISHFILCLYGQGQ